MTIMSLFTHPHGILFSPAEHISKNQAHQEHQTDVRKQVSAQGKTTSLLLSHLDYFIVIVLSLYFGPFRTCHCIERTMKLIFTVFYRNKIQHRKPRVSKN